MEVDPSIGIQVDPFEYTLPIAYHERLLLMNDPSVLIFEFLLQLNRKSLQVFRRDEAIDPRYFVKKHGHLRFMLLTSVKFETSGKGSDDFHEFRTFRKLDYVIEYPSLLEVLERQLIFECFQWLSLCDPWMIQKPSS